MSLDQGPPRCPLAAVAEQNEPSWADHRSWAVALLRLSEQQRAIVSHPRVARPALPPPRQASDAGTESAPVLVQQLAVMLSVLPLALGWVPCAQPPRVAQPVTSATPLRAARAGEVQMGVPKFFRWLTERFPQINLRVKGGRKVAEIDNFYLDMNGIIHTCTHGDAVRAGRPRQPHCAAPSRS